MSESPATSRTHLGLLLAVVAALLAVGAGAALWLASTGDDGRSGTAVAPVVVAVGDIACSASMDVSETTCQHEAVADLAARLGPTAVLALGDTQYPEGEIEDFTGVFDRSFGSLKGIMRPVIGNHEYNDDRGGAAGYFDYFNGVGAPSGPAGSRSAPYYSFDIGSWHLIALDSECDDVPGGCGPGSPQRRWLQEDLAAHPTACTLAFWHTPRFTTGSFHEGDPDLGVLWNDLVAGGVDVMLAAHNHNAEVMEPIGVTAPDSRVPVKDAAGVQQFIAGTGGANHDAFIGPPLMASDGTSATTARSDDTFGVLRLTLHPTAYDWSFVGIDGATFANADSRTAGPFQGSRTCQ
jgi:acid phosphatase type 7